MPRVSKIVSVLAFVLAGLLAYSAAVGLANLVERRTAKALRNALAAQGIGWVQIVPDGLTVALSGTAPDESARIRALQVAGQVVDASRILETLVVPQSNAVVAPVFRIEIMRQRGEISVIGLVPTGEGDEAISTRLAAALPGARIADMVQTAENAVPGGWVAAEAFALAAIQRFDVGRVSVSSGRILVEALVDSPEARRRLEADLRAIAPRGQVLTLELVAPRPVAAPFLLRVEAEAGVLRLATCWADTEAAQTAISEALRAAGTEGRLTCPLALGAPSPRWGEAAVASITALAGLGDGELTMSDGSVLLSVAHDLPDAVLDPVVGRLETRLPPAFRLTVRREDPPESATAQGSLAPEIALTLSPEGRLAIEGRLPDERVRNTVRSFAGARFGAEAVALSARLDADLPSGWSVRVLSALEALAELHHGAARVQADRITLRGVSGNPDAGAQVTQVLLAALGPSAQISVDVTYDEALDPVANAPTPDNCEARVRGVLATRQIAFAPGSADISEAGGRVIDAIAEVLRECGELPFEVAGHTDSQGRAETNRNLSQARAEAVINALLARRVLVASLVARGYGADRPIADNSTEAGREANRRIEFTLIRPEPEPEPFDPALEAQLVFEPRTPDADTVRPRQRPGSALPQDVEPTIGSGDDDHDHDHDQ